MKLLRPSLDAEALARAFPFHLWLDDALAVRSAGSSLAVALPGLAPGAALVECFDLRRPRAAGTLDDWRRHGRALVTLRSRERPALTLRGSVEWPREGGVLLLVSPVLTSLDAVRQLGLGFEHFAAHDAAGELLLLARSTQMSAQDAEGMAAKLKARSQQLDATVELCEHGIVFFDAAGTLQQVNAALLAMLGLERRDTIGQPMAWLQGKLEPLLEPGVPPPPVFDAHAGGEPDARMLVLARPRRAVLRVATRRSSDGGRVFYLYDVTAATEVDRLKSEFVTTAAHELRTPMASVYGFSELLLRRAMPEAQRRDMLETIHRQSRRLVAMVDELLDLARIEARQGKDLQCRPVRLGGLVAQAAEPLLLQGSHELRLEVAHADALLHVDPDKTVRALANVLSNAMKYSPPGSSIRVDTLDGSTAGAAGDAPAVGVRITDRGIGMTPGELARVCERFWRADPSGNVPGTGLGMSLVQEIVTLQQGRLALESRPGEGTAVTLWLPRAGAGAAAAVQ